MTSRTGLPCSVGAGVLAAVLGVGAAGALGGCADDGQDRAPDIPTAASAATVSAPGAELGTPGAAPQSEEGPLTGTQPVNVLPEDGAALTAVQVRTGAHATFDRIVTELDGTGSPGWSIGLTDDPTSDGSGMPVEFTGRQAMVVDLRGIDMNAAAQDAAAGKDATPPLKLAQDTGLIRSVKAGGASEGQQRLVVGLSERNPEFRVNLLSSPTRLVIDVIRPR